MKTEDNKTELMQLREWMQKKYKTYSAEEIIASGGADEFAKKIGHNPSKLGEILDNLPEDSNLSEEELENALKMLQDTK